MFSAKLEMFFAPFSHPCSFAGNCVILVRPISGNWANNQLFIMTLRSNFVNDTIENTKLAGLVRSLDKSQHSNCRRFLQSPYFNANENMLVLFEQITKLLERGKPLEKELLWRKISDKRTPYNDVRFRKYCSDLYKLIAHFIALEVFEQDEVQKVLFQLKAIQHLDAVDQKVTNSLTRVSRDLVKTPLTIGTEHYLSQFQIEKSLFQVLDFATKREEKTNIELISGSLDIFFLSEKLRFFCEVQTRMMLKKQEYSFNISPEVILQVIDENPQVLDFPVVRIFHSMYLMLANQEQEQYYHHFRQLLRDHFHKFDRDLLINELYASAQNYCVRMINKGRKTYLRELFGLFQELADNNLLIQSGQVSPWYFRNIVVVGLRLGEYQWVEKFINEFQHYLPEHMRENAVTFNLAQLYYYQKKYSLVLEQLQNVEYEDFSYNLNSKAMLLATYYELDEIDPLYSHLETFRIYLGRQREMPQSKKNDYLHLIRFTKRLIRIIPSDKEALAKLKQDVMNTRGTVNANWLLEKITELGG
jgi:hypothetical protein